MIWPADRGDTGPFDLIGDVHGCIDELLALLGLLGYDVAADPVVHPDGRRALFLGDLVDRGPAVVAVLELVMAMVEAGTALCLAGNHEDKLARALQGRNVRVTNGLRESLTQLEAAGPVVTARVRSFLAGLTSHGVLDRGRLVVSHAGLPERYHGVDSPKARAISLYGVTDGTTDTYGLPVRLPWALDYRGAATVVHGHTPVTRARWVNNTICLDTGAVYGGRLTALRWPERELVAVEAARRYCVPTRPLAEPDGSGPAPAVDFRPVEPTG